LWAAPAGTGPLAVGAPDRHPFAMSHTRLSSAGLASRVRGRSVRALSSVGLLVGLWAAGCRGHAAEDVTERLWVSGVPKGPRAEMSAFATVRGKGDNYLGAFFHGSAYRGQHEVFRYTPTGPKRARIELLQSGAGREVQVETCPPKLPFDACIVLKGDPTGTERYYSRKSWVVRRPGFGGQSVVDVNVLLHELAAEDEALSAFAEGDDEE